MDVDQRQGLSEGRRARKARETRARIVSVALRLVLERGYDATTLDDIADGADISRRAVFHYFPSKEAILQAVEGDAEDAFRQGLAAISDQTPPLDAVEEALIGLVVRYSSEEAMAIDRVMRSTEALRARKQANYERQEKALFSALCEKWPHFEPISRLRILAMAGIGAKRIAAERWRDDANGESLDMHIKQAFAELRCLVLLPGGGNKLE
jgi:AcrR family transcriptional regulator